jgi:hypothetical protein
MATLDATCTWTDGDPHSKLLARRVGFTYQQWAEDSVDIVLNGGNSSDPASGIGEPITHVIVWTKNGTEFTYTVRSWGGQSELDDAVQALKEAIDDAGGTVVSG